MGTRLPLALPAKVSPTAPSYVSSPPDSPSTKISQCSLTKHTQFTGPSFKPTRIEKFICSDYYDSNA